MSNYTPSMEATLREKDNWSYEDCESFASEHPELTTRSVIAKVKNMGLEYTPRQTTAVTKTGEPVVRKSDIVAGISDAFGVSRETLEGLATGKKAALLALADIAANRQTAE